MTDQAVEKIRSSIIDLTLAPGTRIDEPMLLSEFALGRTPAREALNRLAAEGFVSIVQNRGGMFVRGLDFPEMIDILVAQQVAENLLGHLLNFSDPHLADDLTAIQTRYRNVIDSGNYLQITALNEAFHLRMHQSVGNSFVYSYARSTHRHVRRLNVYIYRLESFTPADQREQFAKNAGEHDRIIDLIRRRSREPLVTLLNHHARTAQERLLLVLGAATASPFPIDTPPAEQFGFMSGELPTGHRTSRQRSAAAPV
ncbi:GntR family transcriptional regulator [Pseudarthrobacter sp. NamE5]|uniref:GntR family transcriptional regulator n=1 Tax=Pseudarthrobacter sp. NamE5 TaxID=2576839 RepID=UPI001487333A|nr:GntR family transcriptional regulator [Pseudarthrobacter sp. NamE5]